MPEYSIDQVVFDDDTQQGQGASDQGNFYDMSKVKFDEPEAPDRGWLGDLGSSIARGVAVRLPGSIGHMLKTYDPEGGIDYARDLGNVLTKWEEEAPEKHEWARASKAEGEKSAAGFVRRGMTGTFLSAPESMAPMALGALGGAQVGMALGSVVPGVGTAVGGMVGGLIGAGIATLGTFGASAYNRAYEEAKKQNKDEDTARAVAMNDFWTEGGIEAGANVLEVLTLGISKGLKPLVNTGKQAIRQMLKMPLKEGAEVLGKETVGQMLKVPLKEAGKGIARTMPVETGTEMLQGYLQAKTREEYGMETETPFNAVVESILPSIGMTILFGLGAHGINRSHAKKLRNALTDPDIDPKAREAAADEVAGLLKEQDPELAEIWDYNAKDMIDQGRGIDIEERLADISRMPPVMRFLEQIDGKIDNPDEDFDIDTLKTWRDDLDGKINDHDLKAIDAYIDIKTEKLNEPPIQQVGRLTPQEILDDPDGIVKSAIDNMNKYGTVFPEKKWQGSKTTEFPEDSIAGMLSRGVGGRVVKDLDVFDKLENMLGQFGSEEKRGTGVTKTPGMPRPKKEPPTLPVTELSEGDEGQSPPTPEKTPSAQNEGENPEVKEITPEGEGTDFVKAVDTAINDRAKDTLFQTEGLKRVPGIRLSDATEAGRWAYVVDKGEATQEQFDEWIAQAGREGRIKKPEADESWTGPEDGWRGHLIKARQYANHLKIDFQGMKLEEVVAAIDAKLKEKKPTPTKNPAPKPVTLPAGYGATNKIFTKERADKAREILRKKLNQMNVGIDPEMLTAGMDLAGYHIEAGARKFSAFTKAMIEDIGEAIRPYLKSFYLAVRNYPGFDNKGMESEAELDKTGITYEEFAKQYRDAFEQSKKYTPKQAGFNAYTDKMADLADKYPEYMERFDKETEEGKPYIFPEEDVIESPQLQWERYINNLSQEDRDLVKGSGLYIEQPRSPKAQIEAVEQWLRRKRNEKRPAPIIGTPLIGTYDATGAKPKEDTERGNLAPVRKFKADLKRYAKELQGILGYEPELGKKGKDESADVNVAPAGGNGHILLWKPNSEYGLYVSVPVQRTEYGEDDLKIQGMLGKSNVIMWRATTKKDKWGGCVNQWAPATITPQELAELAKREIDFYDVTKSENIIQEAKDEGYTDEEITDAFTEGEAAGEAEGATLTEEEATETIEAIADGLGIVDIADKGDILSIIGEDTDDNTSDGSTRTGSLEENKPGNIPSNGGRQGARKGKRGSGRADIDGNGDVDAGEDDGAGSLAGEPAIIHLPDEGATGGGLSAGTQAGELEDQPAPPSEPRSLQLSGDNPGNYRITTNDQIGSGTRGQKIDRNIAAIRLVKQLEEEKRYPTKEEQGVLAKYVGWGGLKKVFDKAATLPQDINARKALEEILSKDEMMSMFLSITDAHYTSPEVISSIYDIVKHMGFKGGNVLEPTYGAGNFLGLMPDDLAASSKWYGSELDSITAKIGQLLYPDSQLIESGFQTAEFPFGKFDLAIGNPPFGDTRIADTKKNRAAINRFKIHNYVIAKEGMHLKPGGILANVVTNRFLDTADPEAREFLAKQFKLLGAIRLPNDAFAKNAGTTVTTDLVFFQRLMPDETPDLNADWLTTGATMENSTGEIVTLNKYFAQRPYMMLGEPSMKGTMYGGAWKEGGKGEFTLDKREGQNTGALIKALIKEHLSGLKDIMDARATDKADAAALSLTINKEDVGIGGFYQDGDKVYMRGDDDNYGNPTFEVLSPSMKWTEKTALGDKRYNRIKGMLNLRAKAYALIEAERFDNDNIEKLRKDLNKDYDSFVKDFGYLSEPANFGLMSDDIKIEFGLESGYKKAITPARAKALGIPPAPAVAIKASILSKRVFYPEREIIFAKDTTDGYGISLSQKGKLDLGYIAGLTGQSIDEVTAELSDKGLIYQDPETNEWVQEDEYLSGNVKAKYAVAIAKGIEKNAEALKEVFPPDKRADQVYAPIGATWIPETVYRSFGEFIGIVKPGVMISHDTGKVFMGGMSEQNDVNVAWQNPDYAIADIFNAAAGHKTLVAYDGTGDDREVNKERTKGLAVIVKGMKATFDDWIMADNARATAIVKQYNDTQNTHAKRKFDGKHLHTVGASPAIELRNTQRDAAWRMIQSPSVLLDHAVGAGKTFTIITGIMERVRMGLSKKAMIVVPNHLVGQWAADWLKLYPGANILAATNKDFTTQNRRRLFSRITTGNYDAVIVGHSSFGFIPIEKTAVRDLIMEEIAHLERAERDAVAAGEKRMANALAKRIQKKRERIIELMSKPRDNVSHFEQMGIDHLVVDESHEFKNLEYSSSMQNVTGMGNPSGSKRAFDLYSKIRGLVSRKGTGITFATGTPISNSLVEMYAILRYLNRQGLVDRKLEAFDAWASAYATTENRIEYTASQKLKDRVIMATFRNVRELVQLYEEFADSITLDDLKVSYAEQMRESNRLTGRHELEEFPVPKIAGGGRQLDLGAADDAQGKYVDYLVARAQRLEELGRENDPKVDNHLWLMSDARKMALDIRLVDPTARPGKNNKIVRAAKNIKKIYDKWNADKGTQLVFCDLSTPAKTAQGDAARFIREAAKVAKVDNNDIELLSRESFREQWAYLRHTIEREIDAISESREAETAAYMQRRETLEQFLENKATDSQLAYLTTADTGFSVYDDLKAQLIRKGIPEGEIKFIHEAKSAEQKKELFGLVNSGAVRVLIGSTPKMGAGTNAQERMVAIHHMDAPWRPSDVEQREGRLVRQGNSLYERDPDGFMVDIIAYSTSNTFDAVMWQILSRKQDMLNDFRSGKDTIEDQSNDSASYADFMAETTGNPAFKEKFRLEGEIEELTATKRRVQTRRKSAEHSLESNERSRKTAQSNFDRFSELRAVLEGVDDNHLVYGGNKFVNDIEEEEDKETARLKKLNDATEAEYEKEKAKVRADLADKYPEGFSSSGEFREDIDNSTRTTILMAYKKLKEKAGIKDFPNLVSFDRDKLARQNPQGALAAALKIRKDAHALAASGGVVTFQAGRAKVTIEVDPTEKKDETGKPTGTADYTISVNGIVIETFEDRGGTLYWHQFSPYLSHAGINSIVLKEIELAKNRIARYDEEDVLSRQTLDKLQFKDEAQLAAKKARLDKVVKEVNALEIKIARQRAQEINKYIDEDRERFPNGYEFDEEVPEEEASGFVPTFTPAGTRGLRYENMPVFLKTKSAPAKGPFKAANLHLTLAPIIKKIAANTGFQVKVIQNNFGFPPDFLARAGADFDIRNDKVYGAYDPATRTVYLVADNTESVEAARKTLFEELIGHAGLPAFLGPKKIAELRSKVYDQFKHAPDMQKIIRDYGLDITDASDRLTAGNEFMVHNIDRPGLMAQVIAYIREALRRMGFRVRYTDADMRALVGGLMNKVEASMMEEKGAEATYETAPAYSKEPDKFNDAFRKWFGDSKVVDENGEPLVVYHGTAKDFEKFLPGGYDPELSGKAIWFTDDALHFPARHNTGRISAKDKELDRYREGTRVLPVYLRMENPHVVSKATKEDYAELVQYVKDNGRNSSYPALLNDADIKAEREAGYDGIIYHASPDLMDGTLRTEYVVFDSTQIKSVYNQGAWDATDDRISFKKVTTSQLREETDAALAFIGEHAPRNLPHMSFLERMLKNPLWYDHPVMKKIFNIMMRKRSEWYHERFNDFNDAGVDDKTVSGEMNALKKTNPKAYEQLQALLITADTEWVRDKEVSFEDRIKDLNIDSEAKRVALVVRAAYDKILDSRQAPMKELIKQIEEAGYEEDPFELHEHSKNFRAMDIRPRSEFSSWTDKDGKERSFFTVGSGTAEKYGLPVQNGVNYIMGYRKDGGVDVQAITFRNDIEDTEAEMWWDQNKDSFRRHHKDIKAELRQTLKTALMLMDEWRGYYSPRLREYGKWQITAKREVNGETEYWREHANQYGSLRAVKRLEEEGWSDITRKELEKLPETVYGNIKAVDVAHALAHAASGMKGKMTPELYAKFNEDLIEQAVDMIRERGSEATKIHRVQGRIVQGYIEDPEKTFVRYASSTAGGSAKADASRRAAEYLLEINPAQEPRVYETAKKYIEENLRNADTMDRYVAIAKSAATFKFLGFNLRSPLVNMTAMVTTVPAAVHQYAGNNTVSMGRVNREIARAGRDFAKFMAGKGKLDDETKAILDEVKRKGEDDPQLTRDALGALQGGIGNTWGNVMKAAMWMFGITEKWNRGSTLLAAYRIAKERLIKEGMSEDAARREAFEIATDATIRAHAGYGKANLPEWAQGTAASARVGQAMYIYGNFAHNYVQMLYDLGFKKKNIAAFTWALAAPMVLVGGAGLPFKDELAGLLSWILRILGITSKPIEKIVWDGVRDLMGTEAEVAGRRGVMGLAGIDISGSLGISLGFPTGFIGMLGAIGGVIEDMEKAGHFLGTGQPLRAAEKAAPTGLGNILKAIRESERGITTEKGNRVWDDTGRPMKPTTGETTLRALGFKGPRQAILQERAYESVQIEQRFADRKKAIYEEARAYFADPDRSKEDWSKIWAKVKRFNDEILSNKLKATVPLITPATLHQQAKKVSVPTKKERGRLSLPR